MVIRASDGYRADAILVDGVERACDVVWFDVSTHEVGLVRRNERGDVLYDEATAEIACDVVVAKTLKIEGLTKR